MQNLISKHGQCATMQLFSHTFLGLLAKIKCSICSLSRKNDNDLIEIMFLPLFF